MRHVIETYFAEVDVFEQGKEYAQIVGYRHSKFNKHATCFFAWALYQVAFHEMPPDFSTFCIKIPYYIVIAHLWNRARIQAEPLWAKDDGISEIDENDWYDKVKKYMNEMPHKDMSSILASRYNLQQLKDDWKYLDNMLVRFKEGTF